ncbi:H-2 class II histocompatibility antigen, E-S beta chain-like [Archocentrus centrarchus]|uniref:H-2 class II histocompatibility antigen, E-S beta chain-like n=1 Tax=Archocentrus centrarchus TaxID=63155 RepID=UPI0011EA4931|nr:H-2 class II histocompatibility antigen, E-S beta chain-like [Archocentrus centrarchus]
MASSFLCFTLLFFTIYTADSFMEYVTSYCEFNSTELKDIEYVYSHYYNKVEYVRFSSSVGEYVGLTAYGIKLAESWNNDTVELNSTRARREKLCQPNIKIWYSNILTKSVRPTVRLQSLVPPSGHHPAMLVCSVYNFYPSEIKVSWLRDGQEITADVNSTEEMPNGDWYYQTHSQLVYTPRSGEKISCVVEHASLKEPLITDWDPSSDPSESSSESKTQIAVGASILTLGLIFCLAGFFYYRWKGRGQVRTYRPVHTSLKPVYTHINRLLSRFTFHLQSSFRAGLSESILSN